MSKMAGTHRAGSVVLISAAASIAVASVLLSYLVSPVAVIGLTLGCIGIWTVTQFKTGALVMLPLSLPLGRLTLVEIGPVPVSPVTVLVAALAGGWLWQYLTGREKMNVSQMQFPMALFLFCSVLGLYRVSDTSAAVKTLLVFAMSATVYLVVSQTIRSPVEVRRIMWAIAVAAGTVGLYASIANIWGFGGTSDIQIYQGVESYNRVEGIFTHPNYLGGFFALSVPPMFALAASESNWFRRTLGYLLVAAALSGLVLSYSRAAWIGTGIGLLILLPLLRRGSWLVPGLAMVGAFTTSGAILERAQSIAAAGSDPAVTSRFEVWQIIPKLVVEQPLLGAGLGNFQAAYGNLMSITPANYSLPSVYSMYFPETLYHAHNLFFNLAVEIGLLGAGAFMWLLIVAFSRVWQNNRLADRQDRLLYWGLGAGLIAVLIQNLADVTLYQGFIALLFFIYLGLLDSTVRQPGREK